MAPPPVGGGGEYPAAGGETPRSIPTPFLTKTYQLVDDHAIDDIISWNEDGSGFVVWNPTEFARDLLPKYFKHNNFSSFVRQLNTYGFRKVVPDRWEFSNDCFRRGEKKLLCDIQRRKIAAAPLSTMAATPSATVSAATTVVPALPPQLMESPSESGEEQVLSSSNSPGTVRQFIGGTAELIGENERLRTENTQLNKELSHMKNLCSNIYSLMSNFVNKSNDSNGSSNEVVAPLDLLPMARFCNELHGSGLEANGSSEVNNIQSAAKELSGRLFGVPIGTKRGREGEGEGTLMENDMDLQLQQPRVDVKSEPLDEQNSGDNQENLWLRRCDSRNQRVCNEQVGIRGDDCNLQETQRGEKARAERSCVL